MQVGQLTIFNNVWKNLFLCRVLRDVICNDYNNLISIDLIRAFALLTLARVFAIPTLVMAFAVSTLARAFALLTLVRPFASSVLHRFLH